MERAQAERLHGIFDRMLIDWEIHADDHALGEYTPRGLAGARGDDTSGLLVQKGNGAYFVVPVKKANPKRAAPGEEYTFAAKKDWQPVSIAIVEKPTVLPAMAAAAKAPDVSKVEDIFRVTTGTEAETQQKAVRAVRLQAPGPDPLEGITTPEAARRALTQIYWGTLSVPLSAETRLIRMARGDTAEASEDTFRIGGQK